MLKRQSLTSAGLVLVLITGFSMTGCGRLFQSLADVTPGRGDRQVTYNTDQPVMSGEDRSGVNDETAANLDRILAEHPDAENKDQLEELRRELNDKRIPDADPEGPDQTQFERLSGLDNNQSIFGEAKPPPDDHDRRVMNWPGTENTFHPVGPNVRQMHHTDGVDNELAVSRNVHRHSPLGRRGESDFRDVPRQSSMSAPELPVPIHQLTGASSPSTVDVTDLLFEP